MQIFHFALQWSSSACLIIKKKFKKRNIDLWREVHFALCFYPPVGKLSLTFLSASCFVFFNSPKHVRGDLKKKKKKIQNKNNKEDSKPDWGYSNFVLLARPSVTSQREVSEAVSSGPPMSRLWRSLEAYVIANNVHFAENATIKSGLFLSSDEPVTWRCRNAAFTHNPGITSHQDRKEEVGHWEWVCDFMIKVGGGNEDLSFS